MRIVIPTTGSLGDVQPYVALGSELQAHGHDVRIATHADFESLVLGYKLEFWPIEKDSRDFHAADAGRKMFHSGGNPFVFLRQFVRLRQPRMARLMAETWRACRGADLILGSSTALLIGHAVAEKLGVPFVSSSLQPTIPTRYLANSFFPPWPSWAPFGAVYNLATHVVAGEMLWQMLGSAINRARSDVLGLAPFPLLGPVGVVSRIPVLHAFSSAVIPRPLDWAANNHMTGFWFLRRRRRWKPSARLLDFLRSGPSPVYVGFGSMPNENPEETTRLVTHALDLAGQRGLLATGWGGLTPSPSADHVLCVDSAPHDWLFRQVSAVVHHGGAGTCAAGMRAGVPNIVVPYMADQPFWGQRVHALGIGPRPIPRRELTPRRLADAIRTAVSSLAMREQAAKLGSCVRAENGVCRAAEIIQEYRDRDFEPAMARPTHAVRRHQRAVAVSS